MIEASLKHFKFIISAGYWDFDDTIQHYIDEDLPIVIMFVGVNGTEKQHQWRR